jgi:small subunit ribosomal protein S6
LAQESKRMYEGMFLVDSALATSDWEEMEAELQRVFSRAEADVIKLEKWEDRRLCYDISGHKRGFYILTYFHADPDRISSIERDVKLNEKLLRVLLLRADRIPESVRESPTPIMLHTKPAPEDVPDVYASAESDVLAEKEPDEPKDVAISETKEPAAPEGELEMKPGWRSEDKTSDELKKTDAEAVQDESS